LSGIREEPKSKKKKVKQVGLLAGEGRKTESKSRGRGKKDKKRDG